MRVRVGVRVRVSVTVSVRVMVLELGLGLGLPSIGPTLFVRHTRDKTVATAYTKAFALNAICCRENEGETRAEARPQVRAHSQIRDGGIKKGGRKK